MGRTVERFAVGLAVVSLAAFALLHQNPSSIELGQETNSAFRVADNDFGRLSPVRGRQAEGESVGSWRERDERELTRESRKFEHTVSRAVKRSSSFSLPSVVEEIERDGRDADSDRSGARASFSLPKRAAARRSQRSSTLPSEPMLVMDIRRDGQSADFDENHSALSEETEDTRSSSSPLPSEPSVVADIRHDGAPGTSGGRDGRLEPKQRSQNFMAGAKTALPKLQRASLASTSSTFGDNAHPDAREEYDISKAREYKLTEPDEKFLEKNAALVEEAQKEYALEEGVRSTAGVGVPKAGEKWGGGLEEFGIDIKDRPIKTSGYAWMP